MFNLLFVIMLFLADGGPYEHGPYEYTSPISQEYIQVVENNVRVSTTGASGQDHQLGNPMYPKVHLWEAATQWDTGYCEFVPGSGWSGASWPVPSHQIKETRLFRAGGHHRGVDIEAPIGTPVGAASAGTIVWAGKSMFGYGNAVAINHGSGYVTVYAHLGEVLVSCGQNVGKGATIGLSGQTGLATWPHVHFEIRVNGLNYDPLGFLSGYIIIPSSAIVSNNGEETSLTNLLDELQGGN